VTIAGVLFGLVLLLASGALADFESGCAAFERGDCAAAPREWAPLAEQGHPQAQFRLGCLYTFGQGVPEDHAQALRLYRMAAARVMRTPRTISAACTPKASAFEPIRSRPTCGSSSLPSGGTSSGAGTASSSRRL
jgi:hypothetical protein